LNSKLTILLLLLGFITHGQPFIKVKGYKINYIDKEGQKQGEWLYFNKFGEIKVSCTYENDVPVSPVVIYENNDTAMVWLPSVGDHDPFVLYGGSERFTGSIVNLTDSTYLEELPFDSSEHPKAYAQYLLYRDFTLPPVFYFAQKKLIDELAVEYAQSTLRFNKQVYVNLSINSSGLVTDVQFPKEQNSLTAFEESELQWIFVNLKRWQPSFKRNKTEHSIVVVQNSLTISYQQRAKNSTSALH
jgi:hypothetical protein